MKKLLLSLPARGAWVEIEQAMTYVKPKESLPARGAWVEIFCRVPSRMKWRVAPRTGSVG